MELAAQRLIVALDDMDQAKIHEVVTATRPFVTTYKIGLALFVAYGPKILSELSAQGAQVFLDLKLHDIPMQVRKALENALKYSPRFVTVHAQGGRAMLQEVAKAANGSGTKILAVTMLTSLSQNDMSELGLSASAEENVLRLADLALQSGIDGLVSSPREIVALRKEFGANPYLVCPGIRAASDCANDQSRTESAYVAIRQGANALVVGRPITQAENCLLRAEGIHTEILNAMKDTQPKMELSI
jgi:orotidine-5'-phosphate decarboxylase